MSDRLPARLKVLYVEDEPDIRIIVEMALGMDPNIDPRIADTGAKALEIVGAGWRPDIALLDMMMPGMNGKELLDRLRAMPSGRDLPVLFITASARQVDVAHYLQLGADGVITKPFDPLALAGRVRAEYERVSQLRRS